jgi:hypothetical protein
LPTGLAITAGLAGAVRLATGRADGLRAMETTLDGAARSFWAAAICLPPFLAMRLLGDDAPVTTQALLAELVGYVIGWTAFPLLSRRMAIAGGRGARWPLFVAAWNWCNVIQYTTLILLTLATAMGLPTSIATVLGFVVLGYALWLGWFLTRHALAIDGFNAIGFVLIDVATGILVSQIVTALSKL